MAGLKQYDIVFETDELASMPQGPLGKTMETCPAKDDICRAAEVKTARGVCEDRKKL